jgi:hypothetical protein
LTWSDKQFSGSILVDFIQQWMDKKNVFSLKKNKFKQSRLISFFPKMYFLLLLVQWKIPGLRSSENNNIFNWIPLNRLEASKKSKWKLFLFPSTRFHLKFKLWFAVSDLDYKMRTFKFRNKYQTSNLWFFFFQFLSCHQHKNVKGIKLFMAALLIIHFCHFCQKYFPSKQQFTFL